MLPSYKNVSACVCATRAGQFGVRTLQPKEISDLVIRVGLARIGSKSRYKA